MEWRRLGVMAYREAWALQEELRLLRREEAICDRLLLVTHPPVVTLGRRACSGDLLSTPAVLAAHGIECVQSNRGGRATYHGPGQLVGYFICNVRGMGLGVAEFVHSVEELCLGAVGDLGVACSRDAAHPGLWVGREKIVAIGLHVARGITQHGFALNVDCDLGAFRHIVACGIAERGVTSLARLLAAAPAMAEVEARIIAHAGRVFGREMVEVQEGSGERERLGV